MTILFTQHKTLNESW